MTTYNTGNPLGSTDVLDRYDNTENLDNLVNGPAFAYDDRLGVSRKSWAGFESDFLAFLAASGFEPDVLTYTDGVPLQVDRPTQLIERAASPGVLFSIKLPSSFPVVLTGTFATDEPLLVIRVDSSLRADLASQVDAAKGAGLVGYKGTTVFDHLNFLTGNGVFVEDIAGLRALTLDDYTSAFVGGYYAAYDGGGGAYYLDPSDVVSADNGGTIIVATDGGRWKLAYTGRVSVKQFGAKGDNVQDDQPFIQAALDAVKAVYAPSGSYKLGASIDYKANGYSILGENMNNTVFTSTGTHSLIRNPDSATITRLFCELINVKLVATTIGANIVLDWTSCQLGTIDRVWILGQSTAGCDALRLAAVWTVTECTYNVVSRCLIGLCATGIRITDGANNNTIRESRVQPSFAGGVGILLTATALGRVSSNSIINNGFEFPGTISNGINVLQNCSNIRIQNNRFESLLNGIIIGATGNSKITALPTDNYFSSNTTNINITAGSTAAVSGSYGAASTTTAGAVLTVAGRPFNLTPARTGVGVYTFTFATQPADTGYTVSPASSAARTRLTAKSTASFTITTEDAAGAAADATLLDVSVLANR